MWTWVLIAAIAAGPADGETVRLDLAEPIELKVLVDYVATSTGQNILYDETVLKKKVNIRAPTPLTRSALTGLLKGILRANGLALVPAEQAGWQKVVSVERLSAEAGALRREMPGPESAAEPVAFLLELQHVDPTKVSTALTPYLTKPGGVLMTLPENRAVVIIDYGQNVQRLVELGRLMDQPSPAPSLLSIRVLHQDTAELIAKIEHLLNLNTGGKGASTTLSGPTLSVEPGTGNLLVMGTPDQIGRIQAMVPQLDVPVNRRTEVYRPRFLAVARLRGLLEQVLPAESIRIIQDDISNTVIISAAADQHARIAELVRQFDAAPPDSSAPMRFYKLMERRADDVFVTLAALLGASDSGGGGGPQGTLGPANIPIGNDGSQIDASATPAPVEPNKFGFATGAALRTPERASGMNVAGGGGGISNSPGFGSSNRSGLGGGGQNSGGRSGARVAAIQGANFSIALDDHTNSIIVIATPEIHQQVARLIQRLDKRRPQVLVQVTLVSLSMEDSLNLGTELEALDLGDAVDYLTFTSFGLSTVDPTTGARTLIPGPGANGVILTPDKVPFIFRALATKGKTRVYSAPRILVDDNATGSIESVSESPFTSVNASTTVATTSFAGFAKAGTQLQIEPHIAEGDHLELRYTLTVSSFTGAGTATVPPPRSSDTINSTVRVPDGHTVIVGGLLSETMAETSSHVPLIGELPVGNVLFGNQSRSKSKVRLYAFITPSVLRHDRFEDLKYISEKDLSSAELPSGMPPARTQFMEAHP